MWGGIKIRKNYNDVFKKWSATKGLETLRESLYQEPRPWFLAFSLHRGNHLLQDIHIARLMSWCTTITQLQKTKEEKTEAYRNSQEMFTMLVSAHKPGKQSLLEYFRLCAEGRDLTTAFKWQKYWIETGLEGSRSLSSFAWLLRVALLYPGDDAVEDMVAAVRESYIDLFCTIVRLEESVPGKKNVEVAEFRHFVPSSDEEKSEHDYLFDCFRALRFRVKDRKLLQFIDDLPKESTTFGNRIADLPLSAWTGNAPTSNQNFPQLEGHEMRVRSWDCSFPFLVDSLLHPDVIKSLEEAAFEKGSVNDVIEIIKHYQACIKEENDNSNGYQIKKAGIWRQFSDSTARKFRQPVVEAGGLTAELYHYLITALCRSNQPTAALRTLKRMKDANVRVLDVTRLVCLVAARESPKDRTELFAEQMKEIQYRQRLDLEHETNKEIEHYWKYQYTDFLYYRNRLDKTKFLYLVMKDMGVPLTQDLLLRSGAHGSLVDKNDLVVLDVDLRRAAQLHFKERNESSAQIQQALDDITHEMPQLDVSLIGEEIPSFRDYHLANEDEIYTDLTSLKNYLAGFDCVFLLDASFIEDNENFVQVGEREAQSEGKRVLVLVPHITLEQIAVSVKNNDADQVISFDPELRDVIQKESFQASLRLQSLFFFLSNRENKDARRKRVLHFTETLLASYFTLDRRVSSTSPSSAALDDVEGGNETMVAILAMLRALVPADTRVTLCSDDPGLEALVVNNQTRLFQTNGAVELLSSQVVNGVVEDLSTGLINDNPIFDFDGDSFEPKLDFNAYLVADLGVYEDGAAPDADAAVSNNSTLLADKDDVAQNDGTSLWLEMLNDESESAAVGELPLTEDSYPDTLGDDSPTHSNLAVVENSKTLPVESSGALADIDLMNVYEPHEVIPVGEKIEKASERVSLFEEFGSMDPEKFEIMQADRAASQSNLSPDGGASKKRKRSRLEKDYLRNRGASNKERLRMAKSFSNMSGGRVPFNFRYNVVEANVNHPKNQHLKKMYNEGLNKKRSTYRKKSR